MSFPFPRIALVGFGLMGGSLAKALKALPGPPRIWGLSIDPEEVSSGLDQGLLDERLILDPGTAPSFDLLVFATPPEATLELLGAHAPLLRGGPTITDMVSLNAPVLREARRVGLASQFVTSHPLAGGTGSGLLHAREGLFRGATVWLSPGDAEPERALHIQALWRSLGAQPRVIDAEEHDEMMAWVSHLPQLVSNALAQSLQEAGIPRESLGPGGRDVTRLAGSGSEMWRELLAMGSGTLLEGLEAVEKGLAAIREALAAGRVEEVAALMKKTRSWTEAGE